MLDARVRFRAGCYKIYSERFSHKKMELDDEYHGPPEHCTASVSLMTSTEELLCSVLSFLVCLAAWCVRVDATRQILMSGRLLSINLNKTGFLSPTKYNTKCHNM